VLKAGLFLRCKPRVHKIGGASGQGATAVRRLTQFRVSTAPEATPPQDLSANMASEEAKPSDQPTGLTTLPLLSLWLVRKI